MALLKNGGNAVDAVEIAIKVLEDKEVTNAGWGSNLAMDGTVECDASIVDHYGRSGAVGAIGRKSTKHKKLNLILISPEIRNPIHLARLVLDHANKPLSLRRIPPNLLVGPGAVDFAYDQGIPVLPHDFLVSPGARSRWLKWKYDLEDAESPRLRASEVEAPSIPEEDLASCWNESQPYSPVLNAIDSLETKNPHGSHHSEAPQILANTLDDSAGNNEKESTDKNNIPVPDDDGDGSCVDDGFHQQKPYDGNTSHSDEDMITDTVGAIAVDRFGNIAAGSSSGGIGMKRRGRIGPAALVNVGTAVIPVEINDPNKTSVASVTSGTGEHMGTTLAAGLCASRVYSSIRRSATGGIEPIDDDGAMKAFVERDFMGNSQEGAVYKILKLILIFRSSKCATQYINRRNWSSKRQKDGRRRVALFCPQYRLICKLSRINLQGLR